MVKVGDALAGKLQVLALVLAHGYVSGAVDENVGGLEDGIREEAMLESTPGFGVIQRRIIAKLHFTLLCLCDGRVRYHPWR